MTNAEKFEEVFGKSPDCSTCPLDDGSTCLHLQGSYCTYRSWDDEFKEVNNVND